MNVLQHTRNELNLCLKENRLDRSYRDTLLINQFVRWAGQNTMNSNSTKCKELIMYKKRHPAAEAYNSILGIPQTITLTILGLTFQPNCKFSTHLKEKLCKANKCSCYSVKSSDTTIVVQIWNNRFQS